ncbi:hypothetical protein MLD38_030057 [Melastoma candidum]|uniref:Uncharacterized protein n=1 Tax=Melastoma candidum TaxID=119954 RepID=A0ACB9MK65_9MYRT|nr:hypothetical protein MLD38_030057 [Melastoma candidum]
MTPPAPDSHPRVHFVHLPNDGTFRDTAANNFFARIVESYWPHVSRAVAELASGCNSASQPCRLGGFVLDMLCTSMIDGADSFRGNSARTMTRTWPNTTTLIRSLLFRCKWNSILESKWFRVPIATWPLNVEQQLNAFQQVKKMRLAAGYRRDFRMKSGVAVSSDEIRQGVRARMENSREKRRKMEELRNIRALISCGHRRVH